MGGPRPCGTAKKGGITATCPLRRPRSAKGSKSASKTTDVPPADLHEMDGITFPSPVTHIFLMDQHQAQQRLANYKPLDIPLYATDCTESSGPGQLPQHFKILDEWNYRLPRFLFRGFNSHSGGDSGLNRSRMIQPHAFYGTHNKVEPWPWDQGGKPVTSLSLEELQRDVNGHLVGSLVQSHFSSWAADFHTALSYAGAGDSSMIAVLDTTLCGTRTAVYHVPALMAAGVACGKYPHEYLVYGPVIGAAYCCFVPVPSLITEGLRSYHFDSAAVETPVTISDLDQASNVASLFRHENYKTAGPALFLTVFAAELSRLKRPNRLFPQRSAKSPWSLNDTATILRYLDPRIYDAALFSHEPLVNRDTYVDRFEQLRCMVDLLATVEEEIRKKRREWLVMTEYDPNAGHLAGPQSSTRGAKRKSDCPGSSQSRPKRADMSKRGRPRGCDQPLIRAAGLEKGTSGSLLPAGVKRHKRAKRRAQ